MKILAIIGSYRKGKTIDTLVDKAIEGAKAGASGVNVEKLYLVDKHIEYCRNCMTCKNDDPGKKMAACVIADDMQAIYPMIDEADSFIFGTPVNYAHETAVTKAFIERIAYIFARPGKWPIQGCPEPRTTRKKRAIIIVSSGVVPPLLRIFCDEATPLLKDVCRSCLNTRVVGCLYAGAVANRGVNAYLDKASQLGRKLVT